MIAFPPVKPDRLWALVQKKPRQSVLMVSSDRASLSAEMRELAAVQTETGDQTRYVWSVVEHEIRSSRSRRVAPSPTSVAN